MMTSLFTGWKLFSMETWHAASQLNKAAKHPWILNLSFVLPCFLHSVLLGHCSEFTRMTFPTEGIGHVTVSRNINVALRRLVLGVLRFRPLLSLIWFREPCPSPQEALHNERLLWYAHFKLIRINWNEQPRLLLYFSWLVISSWLTHSFSWKWGVFLSDVLRLVTYANIEHLQWLQTQCLLSPEALGP